jgi:hypothetical protein
MTNKLKEQQEVGVGKKPTRRLLNTPSRTLAENQAADSGQDVVDAPGGQVYSSEEQALEVLVGSIVAKLADSPKDQLEMAEFLEMVLDTDPELRSEILAETTIRK